MLKDDIRKHIVGVTEARLMAETWKEKNVGLLMLLIKRSPRGDMVLVAQRLLEESKNLDRSLSCAERIIELLTEDNEKELVERLFELQPTVFSYSVKIHSLENILIELSGEEN